MSGDVDTSCGNSIVNADAIYIFLHLSGVEKYDMMIDGDDSILIVESTDKSKLQFQVFHQLGFNTKYSIKTDKCHVDYCQSRLVMSDPPSFVRNPVKALSNMFMCRHKYEGEGYKKWLAGVGSCEAAINYNQPILGAIGDALSTLSDKVIVERDLEWRMAGLEMRKYEGVTEQTRVAYFHTFGVLPDVQLWLEQSAYLTVCRRSGALSTDSAFVYFHDGLKSIFRTWEGIRSLPKFGGSCWWSSCESGG